MRYVIDNDLHIHSQLSICSDDPEQTGENILKYAKKNNLKTICLTDHYWDQNVPLNTAVNWWYEKQNHEHISRALPLPQDDEVSFLFGCEADMDSDERIGVSNSRYDDFGFIIVSTTHFHHMTGPKWEDRSPEELAKRWIERFEAVMNSDLPFGKVGIAHLTCDLIAKTKEDYLKVLDLLPEEKLNELFSRAAAIGLGIELNIGQDVFDYEKQEIETVMRMYHIAKQNGCKFYFGSDAHIPMEFEGAIERFNKIIDILNLTEDDKFIIKQGV